MREADKIDRILVAFQDQIAAEHPEWHARRVEREAWKRYRESAKVHRYFSALGSGDHVDVTPATSRALSAIGRRGGLASRGKTSAKKAAASRANGKLGGRPRKQQKE